MEQTRRVNGADLVVVESGGHGQGGSITGHVFAVGVRVMVLGVDGCRQGRDHGQGRAVLAVAPLDTVHDGVRPFRQMLGHQVRGPPENDDLVFAALLGVIHRQVRVVHELLGAGRRVGRGADAHADRQGLEAPALRLLVDLPHPVPDLPGHFSGPLGILEGQQHGKHLAAGAEHGAALSHAAGDGLADEAQGRVALSHTVELVIELEVVHVDVHQRQTLPAAGAELLLHLFHEEAVIVHAGQGVDAGLPEHFFVQGGVFHGDGRDGADRLQKADLHGAEAAAPLLGGQQHQSHDLLPVPHGGHAVDIQPAEQLLFRLPDGEVAGAVLELADDQIGLLLF